MTRPVNSSSESSAHSGTWRRRRVVDSPVSETSESVRLDCRSYGDAAVLVDVMGASYEDRWATTQAIGRSMREVAPPGYVDVVASYEHVVVFFDPVLTDAETMSEAVLRLQVSPLQRRASSTHEIPVLYGERHGPDLEAVAEELDMHPSEVVELHSTTDWVVRFVGSPAGAPMLDGWRVPTPIPRLHQPRPRVVSGSVGVSGMQSTIYNAPSPGGWRLIGRTPEQLFHRDRTPPVRYAPGDRIRFVPVEDSDLG